jgi:hypothetical protein
MAAKGVEAQVALAEVFCDVGRGVRQSIALQLRIQGGGFVGLGAGSGAPDLAGADRPEPAAERDEAPDRPDRADWNEYERPDYGTPLRLTGDPAADEEAVRVAVQAAVVRFRRTCDRGLEVVARVEGRPTSRGALLAGSASPRAAPASWARTPMGLDDSS